MIAVAITREEGGVWLPFVKQQPPDSPKGNLIHAIVFDNGAVWDAYNGWRQKPRREALPRIRVKMGRKEISCP